MAAQSSVRAAPYGRGKSDRAIGEQLPLGKSKGKGQGNNNDFVAQVAGEATGPGTDRSEDVDSSREAGLPSSQGKGKSDREDHDELTGKGKGKGNVTEVPVANLRRLTPHTLQEDFLFLCPGTSPRPSHISTEI